MTDYIIKILLLVFLGYFSIRDYRKMNIPIIPVTVMPVAGLVLRLIQGTIMFPRILLSFIPGILLLLLYFLTRGGIGIGDVLLIFSAGFYLDFSEIIFMVLFSLTLSAIAAALLMILKKLRFKDSIPFVPFLLGGYLCLLFLQI